MDIDYDQVHGVLTPEGLPCQCGRRFVGPTTDVRHGPAGGDATRVGMPVDTAPTPVESLKEWARRRADPNRVTP